MVQFRDGVVRGVQWVNDDRLVFTVVDFSEGSGRPNGAPSLFAVDPDGKQLLQLVRRQGLPFITDGRVKDRMLEWNHRLLRVPQPKGDQANEEMLIAEMSKGEPYTQYPTWLNTRTGRARYADVNAPAGAVGWMTDGQGEARVVFTRSKDREAAFWRAPGQTDWERLYESDLLDPPCQGLPTHAERGALRVAVQQIAAWRTLVTDGNGPGRPASRRRRQRPLGLPKVE